MPANSINPLSNSGFVNAEDEAILALKWISLDFRSRNFLILEVVEARGEPGGEGGMDVFGCVGRVREWRIDWVRV